MSILPVAAELQRQGHNITVAVRDLARFSQLESRMQLAIVQSPLFFPRDEAAQENLGYCDILAIGGYLAESSLLPQVLAWRQLFALSQADVVVCQHAPTALLSARSCGRPAVVIGSGFMCPPAEVPMPAFAELTAQQRSRLSHTEAEVLATCNRVLERFDVPPMPALASLFRDADTVLCIYPELDHYGVRDGAEYVGPLYADTDTAPIAFPQMHDKNILIYLSDFQCWKNLRAACAGLKANVICVALGMSKQEVHQSHLPHMVIVDHPIPLQSAFTQSDLVVCHGGPGVLAGALAAAKPILMLPIQKEQSMMACCVANRSYGASLSLEATPQQFRNVMEHLLSDAFINVAVKAYADKYRAFTMIDRVQRIARRIVERGICGQNSALPNH